MKQIQQYPILKITSDQRKIIGFKIDFRSSDADCKKQNESQERENIFIQIFQKRYLFMFSNSTFCLNDFVVKIHLILMMLWSSEIKTKLEEQTSPKSEQVYDFIYQIIFDQGFPSTTKNRVSFIV